MTNSIATAKCPSALTSGNYGMSQNRYSDESKDYFFVKLTDSAYRAIEEYQHNENTKRFTNGQRPKIQVNGNSGVIYFPTLDSNEGRKFGFTIDDIEGSLECIQQTSEGLDVLGSIPYRMRIHANDDIYDTTRTKMAIAEETEKSKCIREIKPNQTDIGRKVKKSVPSSTVYPHLSHNGNNNGNNNNSSNNYLSSLSRSKLTTSLNSNSPPTTQHSLNSGSGANERMNNKLGGTNLSTSSSSSRSPNPTLLGGSGTIASGTNSTNNRYGNGSASNVYSQNNLSPSLTSASSLSSTLAGGISNGYASATQHNSPNESIASTLVNSGINSKQSRPNSNVSGSNGNFSRGGGVGAFSSNGSKAGGGTKGGTASNANGGGSKLPDISRRKIRERLIHLLALRPFKKPELYARLQNEGLRDRERSLISNILKDIALSRDNTYNLRRQMWNDVNENWPYYTEQELQQLKRRKPQNLTPPLSSDAGSSTSGQSPTSTHTGSPPPLAGGMNGGNSLKRTSLEYDEPFPPKKQRISHMAATGSGVNRMTATSNNSTGGSGVRAGASFSTISNSKSSNTSFSMQRNKHATAKASTYSPQGPRNTTQSSENSVNSDLSYNVLNNMDDFMLNIENPQGSGYTAHCSGSSNNGSNNARKSNGSGNSKSSSSNPKENRHSGNNSATFSATTNISPKNNTYSGNGNNSNYNVQENEGSSNNLKHTLKRSSLPSSPKSSLPYGFNFVSESSSSNSRSAGRDNSNRSGCVSYRHQSPNYTQQQQQKQQKSSNSVIYSPKIQATANIGKNEREDHVPAGRSSSSSKSQTTSRSMGSSTATTSGSNKQQMRGVGVRTPTPPVQEQQRHLQQGTHYQSQQTHSASTNSPVQGHNNQPQHLHQQEQQQQQHQHHHHQLQFESNSQLPVTQHSVITDAVDVDAVETPNYDFSSYTAITSIEQRREYKTEFERDYDEYRQLLERIEDVRRNFQVLADQLQRAPQGCSDYEHIKEQIVAEYERINNEEELKRDKQRFDYLHAKLAHIKQLVTDYDKTLTSMAAAAAAVAAAQHHQQQQQDQQLLQHASTTAAMHMAAGATSHFVNASTNVLTAATAHNARVSPMVSGSESNHSPPSGYQNQTQYYIQQQLQQQPNQIIQHQQEQHQHQNNDETLHRKKKHTHNILQRHHNQQQQQQQHQQYYLSPENQTHASSFDEQHSAQHHQQREPDQFNGHHHYQGNNNNEDSDSDDSSDSNDEDSNDDDSNDDDDDNGSDHDSNNDDNVNEHF
ncbi:PREDICTED: RNA polymerase II elongation factor Ell [Bactrocera latifrons]|nr:PREDICTED: RNA polymerase II elongation factor Ell [Bactrocera latifrons]XP_018796134.1 PREDICTED: RNA polymerase II elongation factor Ell [Bactrocera latifrons]XP_018796135.1 PREDICTED: RNA polymerase II elongation factor Ell [Bactrocera latifrons]XP_018796136.1 PREDICTED: RNA polymerase II elongation factor Ell [Bactrocera latifrons]XP_018796137.1 PREDICTED: RNA polymerase II elongation factor Ell [Bactrocera latifrons]